MISKIKDKIVSYLPMNFIEKYQQYLTNDNLIILFLIIYSSVISMYTPRSIINLINKPVARILILGLILYTATYNTILAIFIAIAFIITVSIDSSIEISKANLKPIYDADAESFVGDADSDEKDEESEEHYEDKDDEHTETFDSDKKDDDNEEDDDEKHGDDDEDFEASIANNKNLNDQFAQLHSVIHKLEDFMSKNKE